MWVTIIPELFLDGNNYPCGAVGFRFLGVYQLICCVGKCWQTMGYTYYYNRRD